MAAASWLAWSASTLNITERKQMEKQAHELAAERRRTKMLSDFIRDVSHDFHYPLTLIGTSLFLASKAVEPEKQKLYVERAESQIMRLTQLIESAHYDSARQ
ncbi:MAG: histidine kinase dimerization/phospho-acceptor domain-containing protein [Anaerolineae bacterium]